MRRNVFDVGFYKPTTAAPTVRRIYSAHRADISVSLIQPLPLRRRELYRDADELFYSSPNIRSYDNLFFPATHSHRIVFSRGNRISTKLVGIEVSKTALLATGQNSRYGAVNNSEASFRARLTYALGRRRIVKTRNVYATNTARYRTVSRPASGYKLYGTISKRETTKSHCSPFTNGDY